MSHTVAIELINTGHHVWKDLALGHLVALPTILGEQLHCKQECSIHMG